MSGILLIACWIKSWMYRITTVRILKCKDFYFKRSNKFGEYQKEINFKLLLPAFYRRKPISRPGNFWSWEPELFFQSWWHLCFNTLPNYTLDVTRVCLAVPKRLTLLILHIMYMHIVVCKCDQHEASSLNKLNLLNKVKITIILLLFNICSIHSFYYTRM